jgi:hypothetical protein
MSANYRVLRSPHKCQTPVEALDLAEDIQSLDLAAGLVCHIRPDSICPENRDAAEKIVRGCRDIIYEMRRIALKRLRQEFLREDSPPPPVRGRLKRI